MSTSTKRCYYETLEVDRDADESKLKSSFRKLAMKFHPDRNPGDQTSEVKFKEINEAYEILKDKDKRAAYDRYGHAAFEQGGGFGGGGAGFGAGFASSFSDIFEDLFGMAGQRGRGGRERGADLRYNMEITLEEAFGGKNAQIEIPVSVTCEACSGIGAKAGTKPKTCSTCGGAGRVRQSQGFFTLERTCPGCQGRGQMIEDACPSCSGQGRVTRERTLSVNIPQGVEDGTRIRLAGEGEAGVRGGPPGDLYIFLSLAQHQFFQRDGADLHCRVPISMVTAALGGEFEVPTIEKSKAKVKVPAGTQSGRRFRIASKGMPVLRSRQMGDMYVQVVVETPQNLTRKQQELLAEFEKLSSGNTQPESEGFFAKVKDFFGNRAS
ncbi:molecular chaperone DnaJ [Bradyrhizobium sp. 180]|uniref:molecular chaperone DnaJ n=1 Tax=unclassified Bradyrhizobium TaxID=2631580 RepID=UPI001FFB7D9E|nr:MULTISPECIES: molecular chaperone DnaJ [unclassified Bradyrhizobium]MCK1420137.1 molecular chaperone DnaJ [Bradyrhizobium sp. CW12]MCK1490766.1 molecular chaperone DnaJ [Bradyrhizobium sp. 180]MCK1531776.1 molecular chaperone DnaJ [Bradyrhizobium sp. 182]MCK1594344.1 molecular chaperone DnaJ [Bradyrhizobium sp. 164]MCK1621008.1 molecular chaperone DnaJ [Bradyrhizobium sp. 159]